ncbi:unnamed protein product [Brugia pahangi]|uniref:Phlebovirus glycoprotein G2 fusion domain-containing protein n=1 Tax=Brugia pahangi TaxID=6280 RepID=A0A0N4T3B2_BRUPA|nr:unnamed protein product [Brugia pahangi]
MDICDIGAVLSFNDSNLYTWSDRLWIHVRFSSKFSTYYYTSDCFNRERVCHNNGEKTIHLTTNLDDYNIGYTNCRCISLSCLRFSTGQWNSFGIVLVCDYIYCHIDTIWNRFLRSKLLEKNC